MTLSDVVGALTPYSGGLALAATWLGIGFVALRRRLHWRSKRFLTQVNFSLNYVVGGRHLAMRTLLETTALRVWPNEHAVSAVLACAARTTPEQPFLILRNPRDHDFINRAVLNALSERFAEVFVATAVGAPVRTGTFVFALTCERYEVMRTVKLRVLMLEESALKGLFGPDGVSGQLDIRTEIYRNRLRTLAALYDLYVKDEGAEHPILGRVELGVVLPGAGDNPEPNCGTSAAPVA